MILFFIFLLKKYWSTYSPYSRTSTMVSKQFDWHYTHFTSSKGWAVKQINKPSMFWSSTRHIIYAVLIHRDFNDKLLISGRVWFNLTNFGNVTRTRLISSCYTRYMQHVKADLCWLLTYSLGQHVEHSNLYGALGWLSPVGSRGRGKKVNHFIILPCGLLNGLLKVGMFIYM